MLKSVSIVVALATTLSVYADCEISESLKNKSCRSDYFTAKNSKQLNEYLQYGKFKDGKLLNLEIGFNVKDKEINIGTTCDMRIKHDADLRASLNGICLQAKNIIIRRQSILVADKKAPINLIANDSIKIRRANIQTSGDVNISTKSFDPFSNEILVSKDSQISAEKLNISTPSSLIINDDSKIRSSNIVLNGGNCEIGDNDDNRDRERQCRRFKPKFNYSGTCLNNPIPTTLKISSVADKADSLKLTYSIAGALTGSSIRWKFDDEVESSNTSVLQSFLFPGKHLAEAVVSTSNGYFRKLGLYNNVSPTKFNKGQVAIFQFSELQNGPAKVMGVVGLKKFTLVRSEQYPQLYSGEIPADTSGNKLIAIPEFGYKGGFNLVVLPAISNPDVYIGQSVDQLNTLLDSVNSTNQAYLNSKASLQSLLDELKTKIAALSASDKQKIAEYLQANTFSDLQGVTSFKQIKERPTTLFGLLIASAYADDVSDFILNTTQSMRALVLGSPKLLGAAFIAIGGFTLFSKSITGIWWNVAGGISVLTGLALLTSKASAAQDLITDVHGLDSNSLYLKLPNRINSGESTTFSVWGRAIPLDTTAPASSLISQSIDAKNNANFQLEKINSSLASANSTLSLLGFSSQVEPLPLLSFPQTTFPTVLSTNQITNVLLISSEDGQVSIQNYSKNGNNLSITFNSLRTQHAKLRVTFVNVDLGINRNIDTDIVITVAPKAFINYTKNNLTVNFDSTDPQDISATGLTYSWNFGDGQSASTTSKTFSHTYTQAGTYTVSLTVADAYGASDVVAKLIDVNGGNMALVNFCNAGLLPGTMNVSLQGYESFSIDHGFPASGNNYEPHTCGCHSVELPVGQSIPVTVTGGGTYYTESYTFSPLQTSIYITGGTQYFSIGGVDVINGQEIAYLSSGIAWANRCSDVYTYP